MGYLRHECIVVSGWDDKRVADAHKRAVLIFTEHEMEGLVGPVIPHAINGGAAFLISPDGSKEGWEQSERGREARQEYIATLKGSREYLEWCLLLIGGDDGEYRVLDSPNGAEQSADA